MNEERPTQTPIPSQDYPPPPPSKLAQGQVFTGLLIALGLLCMMVIAQFIAMLHNPAISAESHWIYYYIISMQSIYLFAIMLALVVRGFFPSMRRAITIAVSTILLLHFPFGTAVGIYGLRKVDKPVRA